MKSAMFFLIVSTTLLLLFNTEANKTIIPKCPDYREEHGAIEHGLIDIVDNSFGDSSQQTIHITCDPGYDLVGPPKVWCEGGRWEQHVRPHCVARCVSPPPVKYGKVTVDVEDESLRGIYPKGALATYKCDDGFTLNPPESMYRVCEKGIWTGPAANCVPTGCQPPKNIENGYYVLEIKRLQNSYEPGQRIHYSCSAGYTLMGASSQQCLDDGTWSPKLQPVCVPLEARTSTEDDCEAVPLIPHAMTTVVTGFESTAMATAGTEVEVRCIPKYRNNKSPCLLSTKIRCVNGRWVGSLPTCVPAKDCLPPPTVSHSRVWYISNFFGDPEKITRYPINARIAYQCWPGYELEGNSVAVCSIDGCWSPSTPPVCKKNLKYFLEMSSAGPILISVATGAGVLLLLIVICLAIICRRKKPISRAVALPPPVPIPRAAEIADHVTLLNHPDRLALIAYAEGVQQDGQPTLPTYEEAVRDQRPSLTSNRLHRPHWPFLAQRRARNSPEGAHITRQGSFVSHSASTRSGGDPMGSTDTMVVSEGSTAVTLDTVSSHSGSQSASCRAHCGSLASFDTGSVHNTEGVPLLEESEQEDSNIDNHSLAIENRSMADNNSAKLSIASPDIP